MSFRHISELAGDVMRRLEMQGRGSSDERAPAPAYPVTGMRVATDAQREGKASAAFALAGGGTPAAQAGMGKMAEPESPAKLGGQEKRQSEDKRGMNLKSVYRSLTTREHMRPDLRLVSSKGGRAHVQRVAPLGARPSLVLVASH